MTRKDPPFSHFERLALDVGGVTRTLHFIGFAAPPPSPPGPAKRFSPAYRLAVVAYAVEQPSVRPVRAANELQNNHGIQVNASDVRSIWMHYNLAERQSRVLVKQRAAQCRVAGAAHVVGRDPYDGLHGCPGLRPPQLN